MEDITQRLTTRYNLLKDKYRIGYNFRINESDLAWTPTMGEYTKSNIESDHFDGGIFLINEPIPYTERIYEKLIDSRGQTHSVQIDYKDKEVKLTDDMFEIRKLGDRDCICEIHQKCPIHVDKLYFQFNLKNYVLLYWDRGDALNYFRNLTRGLESRTPDIFSVDNWRVPDAMKTSGYYPFFEHCYGNEEQNYIPDKLFFNFPNRKKALERIRAGRQNKYHSFHEDVFLNIDYVNMKDNELVKFLNDRFIKRIKFENLIKTRDYDSSKQ